MRNVHDWINTEKPFAYTRVSDVLRAGALFIIYLLLLKLCLLWVAAAKAPALVWLPDGFAIGYMLLMPRRANFPMLLGVFFANLIGAMTNDFPISSAILGSGVNVMQVGASVWLMRHFTGQPVRALSLQSQPPFYFGVIMAINAIAAAAHAFISQEVLGRTFVKDFIAHFISDALGIVLLTPLIVAWGIYYVASRAGVLRRPPFRWLRAVEVTFVYLGVVAAAIWVFSSDHKSLLSSQGFRPFVYFCIPFLVWIALRFDLRVVTSALLVTAAIAIYYTVQGKGQFTLSGSIADAVVEVQLFLMVLSTMVLITAGLINQQRLSASETALTRRRYDAVMRASGNVVFEINLIDRSVTWSGDTQGVLGWRAEDISTIDSWTDKVHPDDREMLYGIRGRLSRGEAASVKLEYRVVQPNGEYIKIAVSAYGATVGQATNIAGQHSIIGLAEDITAVAAMSEDKRRLEIALRQAQKMETIGQMAGGIAHDFNNVLAAILGYGEMAQEKLRRARLGGDVQDTENLLSNLRRYLETIVTAGERGRALVAQILTFSRRAPETKAMVSLNVLLSEIVDLLRGSHDHDVVLDIESRATRTFEVLGDATALHQLIMNIATNGLQAMSARGQGRGVLSIHLTEQEFAEGRVLPNGALAEGRYALLRIADEGGGIDDDVRAKMFDPFFTTKDVGKGTGLGLSLALAVARAHGGAISVESLPGEGSIFSVYLPLAQAGIAAREPAATPLPEGHGEVVMLVDDEAPLRELGAEILTSLGYQPMSFESSAAAWESFQQAPTRIKLVLTDEVMPELTGTQLAERIHAFDPTVPIIIITAFGGAGFELRAQRAGVSAVLSKPYRADDLARAIAAALAAAKPA
jgi:signal transduction histidine kinase/CheY-like chemotaxis protein/integral membrane sensor domain MASE1